MAPTTRRNGASSPASKSATPPTSELPPSDTQTEMVSPIPPSPYYLLIYPILLFLGSTFSVISPVANERSHATALAPGLSSDLSTPTNPTSPINYFASKRNVLNIYFVKILWFWTTLAFSLILATTYLPLNKQAASPSSRRSNVTPSRMIVQSLLRYGLITLSWYLVTQWLFGPPLIDRSFTLTGGKCSLPMSISENLSPGAKLMTATTSTACKRHGGTWSGGHDISGHVFLLVLSTSFLLLELWLSDRVLQARSLSQHPHISAQAAEQIARETTAKEKQEIGGWESTALEATLRKWTRRFVLLVVSLGGWMLLMTAIWFHSLPEKLSGLGLATAIVWSCYWGGRLNRTWRGIIGGV